MIGNPNSFSNYKPCAGNRKVRIANGTLSAIAGLGNIHVSTTLPLSKVLHVTNLSCNLFSISKITKALNCRAIFYPSYCVFQELDSGKTIGNARECDGLYILDPELDSDKGRQESA